MDRFLKRWNAAGVQTTWMLGGLLLLVAAVPSTWLAISDLRTHDRLVDEVDRSLRADAQLFSERLQQHVEAMLYADPVQTLLETPGRLIPAAEAPDGAFYAVDPDIAPPGFVAYPFLLNLTDSTAFPPPTAPYPDEVSRALPVAALRADCTGSGTLGHGSALGPYGPFPYLCAFETTEAGDRIARGVKLDPRVVRQQVVPEAFRQLHPSLMAGRDPEGFDALFAFDLHTPDTTLYLNAATWRSTSSDAADPAERIYPFPFDLGGLFPGWELRIHTYNELRSERSQRYLVSIIPLLVVLVGLFFASRLTIHEMALNRAKSTFVSNVSHELKTPLTKIRFFNDLLRSLPDDATAEQKRTRYFTVIDQECERLAILIDNVLDFNRIERGEMRYEFTAVPIDELIHEVVETFNVMYETRDYTVALEMEDDLPVLTIDPGAIKRALINLLDNAIKYSEPHTIQVRAKRARMNRQPAVAIAVADEGIGIERQDLRNIFEEFFHVHGERTHPTAGSGLGLALVQHIVDAHGGRIDVDSNPGVGSTFTISLPLVPEKRT